MEHTKCCILVFQAKMFLEYIESKKFLYFGQILRQLNKKPPK